MSREYLKRRLQKVTVFFYPALGGTSLGQVASILVFFPNFKRPKHIFRFLFMYFGYFAYIIDGFFMAFIDTQLLPVPRDSLGPLKYAIHLMYGSVFVDVAFNHTYILFQYFKYGKDNIKWYNLVKDASKEEYPRLFKISHFLFAELYATSILLYIATQLIKLFYERALLIDIIFNCMWMVSNVFIIRFVVIHIPLLYVIATTCYLKVKEKYKVLNRIVQEADESADCQMSSKIIKQYHVVLETINDANKLVKFLMFGVNILIVPFISSLIIITISQTETHVQTAVKWLLFFPASVYSIRGVILTSVLATIDLESKTLYRENLSQIARGNIKHPQTKLVMLTIMEDLSSSKSHLLMKEYGGSVTQMDVFEFIIGVMQFTMLFIEFIKRF